MTDKHELNKLVEAVRAANKITHIFIDADPIAYKGCFSKQKTSYKWVHTDGSVSEVFKNAKDAKGFMTTLEMFGNDEGWTRESIKEIPKLEDVLEAVDGVVEDYLDTAEHFTGNSNLVLKGYLTPSGLKSKDLKGLEKRYQGNRDEMEKPMFLEEARQHLLEKYSWISMCPLGYEADAILITKAEQKGENGLIMYIDKDLSQARGCYQIWMYPPTIDKRSMFLSDSLGWLEYTPAKVMGCGDMFVAYQCIQGDDADGYYGVKGVGKKTAYELLKDCKSNKELLETLYEYYFKKFPNGIQYESWDEQMIDLTAYQYLEQHYNLPYMERKPKDYFYISTLLGEEVVK
jgi:hypothetical protein